MSDRALALLAFLGGLLGAVPVWWYARGLAHELSNLKWVIGTHHVLLAEAIGVLRRTHEETSRLMLDRFEVAVASMPERPTAHLRN